MSNISHKQILRKFYGNTCIYCGDRYAKKTIDHILPISRFKEYTGDLHNKVLSCTLCNIMKHNLTPIEFLNQIKRIANRFKVA